MSRAAAVAERGVARWKAVIPAAFILLLTLCGCATKWMIHTQPAEANLQWSQSPGGTIIRHVMTMDGFSETGTSFSYTMRTILYGKNEGEKLIKPVDVAVGADGRIAIADPGSKSVHLFLPKEERYIRVDKAGTEDLQSPVAVIFDDDLELYLSDSIIKKVFVFDREGKYLRTIDKSYFTGFQRPTGLAYNGINKILYVLDTLSNEVTAYDLEGKTLFTFGERGLQKGQFNYPTHLFFSAEGLLYVTDAMNFRVQMFDAYGDLENSFGHHGDGSGDFAMPKGVAADRNGTIYVVDTLFDSVQLFDRKGRYLLNFGSRGVDQGEFWLPSGLFIDRNNKIYVCDTFNGRVQVFQILGE
jgi:DNA-binding beta-propeller fold protein YncE